MNLPKPDAQDLKTKARLLSELAESKRILSAMDGTRNASTQFCLIVTSTCAGEGKSLITAALAMVSTRLVKRKVLAVDLNWYAPTMHFCLGLEQNWHISDADKSAGELIQQTSVPGLSLLSAPRGGESLEPVIDPDMVGGRLLSQVKESYDFVIVDTSPVFPTNRRMLDPVSMARFADFLVLVVLPNVTPRQEVRRAKELLASGGQRPLGIVINHWTNPLRSS